METRILYQEVHGCEDCPASYYDDRYDGWCCNIIYMDSITSEMHDEIKNRKIMGIPDKYFFPSWCLLEEVENESQQ